MSVKYDNFFKTYIDSPNGLKKHETTVLLADTSGLPALGAGDWTYLTFIDVSTSAYEIVKVTAIQGRTCTIERGQDGTIALDFDRFDLVEHRVCRALLNDIYSSVLSLISAEWQDVAAKADQAIEKANIAYPASQQAIQIVQQFQQDWQYKLDVRTGGVIEGPVTFNERVNFEIPVVESLRVVGDIIMRLNSTPPYGCLLCDGSTYSAVEQPEYEALYNHLKQVSTSCANYIVNEGTKTFKVPNLIGLVPVGAGVGNVGGDQVLFEAGVVVGAYRHLLTIDEMPSHNHIVGPVVASAGGRDKLDFGVGSPYQKSINMATSSVGASMPHNNIQPSFPLYFFIVYK